MNAFLTIIIAKELHESFFCRVMNAIKKYEKFFVENYTTQIYWKDNDKVKIEIKFNVSHPIFEADWIQLFCEFAEQYSVFRDYDSLEIAHYSLVNNTHDPFVVLYIPNELVEYDK